MKKYLSIILSIILVIGALAPVTAFAAKEGNYTYSVSGGKATVTNYEEDEAKTIYIPASLGGNPVTAIGMGAFYAIAIVNVTFPTTMKTIDMYAFNSCSALGFVNFNEGLESIGECAFDYCSYLRVIAIPSTVTYIDKTAFANDEMIDSITVAEGNTKYITDGTSLFDIDRTNLIKYPVASDLQSYTVPYTVTTIGSYSFALAKNLKTLNIPVSVTAIEDNAFSDVTSIKDIYYGGTAEQWNAVSKGSSNDVLSSATIHYSEYPECATHTWNDGEKTKEPTCTEKGETTYTCIICGATDTKADINALGHDFGEWTQTTAPTCVTKGEETRTCSRCPQTETREVSAKGHTPVTDEAVPPTCTQTGLTEGSHCSVCGDTINAQQVVGALGHDFGEWTQTTAPTCVTKGEETRTCSRCPETETRDVDALGHNFGEWAQTTDPTCTEKGEETRTCSRCTETERRDVDALGHDFGEWTQTTAPTCVTKGEETRTCSRCPATEKRDIEPTGVHTWNDGEVTTPATCTEDGVMTYTCIYCPETRTETIPSEGAHKWNDGEVTTRPTCVEEGVKTFTCTSCGATKTEAVEPTGIHTEVTDKAVPATFKKTGLTKGSHCSVCGKVLVEQKTVAKLGAPRIVKLTMSKKGLTAKWKTIKKVHGYKLQISTSKKFRKSKTKTFTVRDQKQAKRTIKRYKKGKYYVRIKAYKVISGKKNYSKWSKAKSITK